MNVLTTHLLLCVAVPACEFPGALQMTVRFVFPVDMHTLFIFHRYNFACCLMFYLLQTPIALIRHCHASTVCFPFNILSSFIFKRTDYLLLDIRLALPHGS